jgi:hypothetical protein
VRRADFLRLDEGAERVVGPEAHAEGMLIPVAGQLQVYEVSLSSERERTLSTRFRLRLRHGFRRPQASRRRIGGLPRSSIVRSTECPRRWRTHNHAR